MIKAGADINKANTFGVVPLYSAVYYGYELIVQMLLEAGVDVNQARDDGRTPLWIANQNDHKSVMQMLIKAGAVQQPK